jgi:3-deoxy-D-manno-octulosonic-acid transferase
MLIVYRLMVYLVLPVVLLMQLVKGFRNRAYWQRWGERLGLVTVEGPIDCWIHAVSVGEVRAVVPLVKSILEKRPDCKICVTTTTPTGSTTVGQLFAGRIEHCYLPYDTGIGVRQFLSRVRPRVGLIVETEIWPNLIRECQNHNVRLAYINVRLSGRSRQRYAKFRSLFAPLLGTVRLFLIQSEADASRIVSIGAPVDRSHVTGSIKIDAAIPASTGEAAQDIRRKIAGDRPVWICGSTRDGEEQIILRVFQRIRETHPKLLLVLVPRHPERFDSVARLSKRAGFKLARRSLVDELDASADVYLADTMGELSLLYGVSDVAFVGGSLVELGGQNLLEPCALGVPVCFGPHMFNFAEISRWVIDAGAGFQVNDEDQLFGTVDRLLSDPNLRHDCGQLGKQLILDHSGALEKASALLAAKGFI